MKYGSVPHFSRPISRIVLGSMALSIERREESFALMDEYVRLGGSAIDTAHVYGPDRHAVVGEYLAERGRETLIVMDKGCHPYGRPRVTRDDIDEDIKTDLGRMALEHEEFFVFHRDDPAVPVSEIIPWLAEQREAGRIDAYGASNWGHRRIAEANDWAEAHGLQGFSLSSTNLSLAHPQDEMWAGAIAAGEEARAWHEATQFPLFAWSSGAAGFFAGRDVPDVQRVYFNPDNLARKARAEELGGRFGVTATQIAVAWVLSQPLNVFAIVGPRTVGELLENMEAVDIRLEPDQLAWLENGP